MPELSPAMLDAQFKPGVGPPARVRGRGLAKRIRDVIGDDPTGIIEVLHDICLDPRAKETDRIMAARELLDRAYGRSPAFAPIEGGDPLDMSELDRAIVEIATKLKAAHPTLEATVVREEQQMIGGAVVTVHVEASGDEHTP
jgi:hypothetical protein